MTPGCLLVVTVVCALGWVFRVRPAAPVWGPVATWVSAAASFSALAASLYIARRAWTAEEQRRHSQDARKLSWWVSAISEDRPGDVRPFRGQGHELAYGFSVPEGLTGYCIVTINNLGEQAVSRSVLRAESTLDECVLHEIGVIPPGQIRVAVPYVSGGTPYALGRLRALMGSNPGVLWIEYADAEGKTWRRLADGSLEPRAGGRMYRR